MKLGRTIAACLFVLALGAYLFFVEKPKLDDEQRGERLIDVAQDRITALTLRPRRSAPMRLEKASDGRWTITEPLSTDADQAEVDGVVRQILDTTIVRRIPAAEAEPLPAYGLGTDSTRVRVELETVDGQGLPSIKLGKTTPVDYQAFAMTSASDDILVTPLLFHTGVSKTLFDLRSKRIFDVAFADIRSLTITTPDQTPIEIHNTGRDWVITSPIQDQADAPRLRSWISALNSLRAISFDDHPPADLGDKFSPPVLSVTVSKKDGAQMKIQFRDETTVAEVPAVLIRQEGTGGVAKVSAQAVVAARIDLEALRNKHAFRCLPDDVRKVSFTRRDGESYVLQRADTGQWTLPAMPERSLRHSFVERAVTTLSSLAGNKIVADESRYEEQSEKLSLLRPDITLELLTQDGQSCGLVKATTQETSDGTTTERVHFIALPVESKILTVDAKDYSFIDSRVEDYIAR